MDIEIYCDETYPDLLAGIVERRETISGRFITAYVADRSRTIEQMRRDPRWK